MSDNGHKAKDDRCNEHIRETLECVRRLIILADDGEADSMDDGCVLLYGVIRDCAYRIRALAETERDSHRAKGRWDAEESVDLPTRG